MHTSNLIIIAIVSYLLGSIPFGYILVRIFTGADVRAQGSGNIGATNVARTGKKGLAIATLVLDAAKGYVAVTIAMQAFLHRNYGLHVKSEQGLAQILIFIAALAALFAVIGHMFPVWLKFKGGKGVATGLGVFIALSPKALLVPLVVFAIVVAITRYVSLGSILAAMAFPFSFWVVMQNAITPLAFVWVCAVALLIIWKHKDNIKRLMAGTEHKLGAKKESAA